MEAAVDRPLDLSLPERQQHRAAMRAHIEEGAQGTIRLTQHEHRLPPRVRGEVVTGGRYLAFVAQEDPAILEQSFDLEIVERRVGVDVLVDTEDAFAHTVIDQGGDIQRRIQVSTVINSQLMALHN